MTHLQHEEIVVFTATLLAQSGRVPDSTLIKKAQEYLNILLKALPGTVVEQPLVPVVRPVQFPTMAR